MKEDGCSDRQCNRTDCAVGKMVLGMPQPRRDSAACPHGGYATALGRDGQNLQ
jgi:hypothetical protein